ncbi:uncharacterized protein LOC112555395 isoform X2 [Pomacea canaliculata]|uniref:uncharacterized protein LOC112555395 isoform X2 n=1 Tax=Pomacea canaliculata TaxID=400727 RepID=UPI000D734247|nr:uncharacterized protein LOC112555395 isoform X2 [Pomacea canaliculata]
MSPNNFIILLLACSSVAVGGYRISRRGVCPVNAATLLHRCTTGTANPYYTDYDPEYCAQLRRAMRCVQSLEFTCRDSHDPAFQQILDNLPFSLQSITENCGTI